MESQLLVVYPALLTRRGEVWVAVVDTMPGAYAEGPTLSEVDQQLRDRLVALVDDDAIEVEYLTCRMPASELGNDLPRVA